MFTGIIESLGTVEEVHPQGSGSTFILSSTLTPEFKVDQSISHDGVCLTVEKITGNRYQVTAISETLKKTNLTSWSVGTRVNLERSLLPGSRLDGHLVQGHVDSTGTCMEIVDKNGSWEYRFAFSPEFAALIIEKGSVCVNGISLTAFNVAYSEFTVAIIPYTYEHTSISTLKPGSIVNIEFDVIGKYLQRSLSLVNHSR